MAQTRTDLFIPPVGGSVGDGEGDVPGRLTLSNHLGALRDDPWDKKALDGLLSVVVQADAELLGECPELLLEFAHDNHTQRDEWNAVAVILTARIGLSGGDSEREAALLTELGAICTDQLLDDERALEAFRRRLELGEDAATLSCVQRIEQARDNWKQIAKRFVEEADSASDIALKTSLLVRAATLVWKFRKKGRVKETDSLIKAALEIQPGHLKAVHLLEHMLRERKQWKEFARRLVDAAADVEDGRIERNLYLHVARVAARLLVDVRRAVACFNRVLDLEPGNTEALEYLASHYAEQQSWEELADLYEIALAAEPATTVEVGLLLQLGMVHWKMRECPSEAEPYFARLRKVDGGHMAVVDFYREFYSDVSESAGFTEVIRDAIKSTTNVEFRAELELELAKRSDLSVESTGSPERTIDAWKAVLRTDPLNAEALTALKKLYAESSKWNALVDLLRNEVDALGDQDVERKVGVLRELAEVYRDFLRMDGMVVNSLNAVLELLPGDAGTLEELARRYRAMGRYNDLILVLSEEAATRTEPAAQVHLYLEVAGLWIDHFSNFNQATVAFEEVLRVDSGNEVALEQLKDIYEKKRAWKPLYEVLSRERQGSQDVEVRVRNGSAMAELLSERLHRHHDAIEVWRSVVSDDPSAPGAFDALEKLSEREKDFEGLADVLELHVGHLDDDDSSAATRVRLLQKLGAVCLDRLDDTVRGKQAMRDILALEPGNHRALRTLRDALVKECDWRGLEMQYASNGDWDGLVEVLTAEADKAEVDEVKIALSFQAARVMSEELGDSNRSLRSYERVLAVEPSNSRAIAALIPIYEADEKWSRVRAMLELQLFQVQEGDVLGRLELLAHLGRLAREQLRDVTAAFEYASAAFRLEPANGELQERVEECANAASQHAGLVELYREVLDAGGLDEEPAGAAATLQMRVAELSAKTLQEPVAAIRACRAVLSMEPDHKGAVSLLEKLYRESKDASGIAEVLRIRLETESDEPERLAVLRELAQLEGTAVGGDSGVVADYYRAILELCPEDVDALTNLDSLAGQAGRNEELVGLLETRIRLAENGVERSELQMRLARILAGPLKKFESAFDVFSEILEHGCENSDALVAVETMVHDGQVDKEMGLRLLERTHEASGRFEKLVDVLKLRLSGMDDAEEAQLLRLRIADISCERLGNPVGAYEEIEAAFIENPGDERLWGLLERAAAQANKEEAQAQAIALTLEAGDELSEEDVTALSRKVASLFDGVLGTPDRAEAFHQKVLAAEPLDLAAFLALKKLWTEQERWKTLQELYSSRVESVSDSHDRIQLLLETCFLYEEILEQPSEAIESYRQVLELSPEHGPSLRNLERLFELSGRYPELADHLQSLVDRAEGPDRIDIMYRLGRLFEQRLDAPSSAVEQYEGVLLLQPTHVRSQEALAGLLAVPETSARAAAILQPIYESQGAYRELAGVLEIRLAGEKRTSGEEVDLLLNLAEILETRLKDHKSAFSAYERACLSDPADERPRAAVARLAEVRETFRQQRAKMLGVALETVEGDIDLSSTLLLELATLLDDQLDDESGAADAYRRLIELDDSNPDSVLPAARALERIHLRADNHAAVAQELARQLLLVDDVEVQGDLMSRLAILYQDVLELPEPSIDINQRRLELTPDNQDASSRLCELLRTSGRHRELVAALRAYALVLDDPDEQRACLLEACSIVECALLDIPAAIEGYVDLSIGYGPTVESLDALIRLYEVIGAHEELADVLQQRAALASSPEESRNLRFRLAELTRLFRDDVLGSIDQYEAILELCPEHEGSLKALAQIMDGDDAQARAQAVAVALPRLQARGDFEGVLSALEAQATADDPALASSSLRRAAQICVGDLNDASRAFGFLARALQLDTEGVDAAELFSLLEAAAEDSGRHAELVQVLVVAAAETSDSDLAIQMHRAVAKFALDPLENVDMARDALLRILEHRPDDIPSLVALEKIFSESGDDVALLDVLRRRALCEGEADVRLELNLKQVSLLERAGDQGAAIEILEDVLMEVPDASAFALLEKIYRQAQRFDDLLGLLDRRLDVGVGRAPDIRFSSAMVCHNELHDTGRGLAYLRDAVTEEPGHAESVELLESILAVEGEFQSEAAEILEPGYLAHTQWSKLTAALEAQLTAQRDIDERKRLLVRLSQIFEDQLEDLSATFEVYARLFREEPRDEHVWERLARLARVLEIWEDLQTVLCLGLGTGAIEDEGMADLAVYTAGVAESRVGDLLVAAEIYGRVLEFDPRHASAFESLVSVLNRIPDDAALAELYARRAQGAEDAAEQAKLLHLQADLLAGRLRRRDEAIGVYRELLDLRPSDERAGDALEQLLSEQEYFPELAEHLRFRADQQPGTEAAIRFRLRLAHLLRTHLGDLTGAIDTLQDVCAEHEGQPDAIAVLEELVQGREQRLRITEVLEPAYRALDQWMKLVAILEAQVGLRESPADQVSVLSEIAELHELRGEKLDLAFDAYSRAFVLEPDNYSVRTAVDRLAAELGCWDTLVNVYESALAHVPTGAVHVDLLTTIARVQDERRGDPRAAINAYERLTQEDPDDGGLLDALEGLYTLVGDWVGLVAVLERKLGQSLDPMERCDLLRRMATVHEDLLGNPDTSIATYRRALEEDERDSLSYAALDRLLTAKQEAGPLAEILHRRLELNEDVDERVELGLRLGALLFHHLGQPDDAIEVYRRVLEDDATHAAALAELASLFQSKSMWPELLETFVSQLTNIEGQAERVTLLCRMAELAGDKLGDPHEAIQHYWAALEEDAECNRAVLALMKLAERDEVRDRAAELLRPLLAEQARYDDLVALEELHLASLGDALERREQLVLIAEMHGQHREDSSSELRALLRALQEEGVDESLRQKLESSARAGGQFAELSSAYLSRAEAAREPSESALLCGWAGRVLEEELGDVSAAVQAYVRAAELDDDAPETLVHLDRLYVRNEAHELLREVLERRVAAAVDDSDRIELLLRLGQLQDERLGDGHGALVAYREVLEIAPADERALSGLERLGNRTELAADVVELLDDAYRSMGAMDRLIALYDIRAQLAPTTTEQLKVFREAAGIWEQELQNPERAMQTLGKALAVDPSDGQLLDEVERIATEHGVEAHIEGLIEAALDCGRADFSAARELMLRAIVWYRDRLGNVVAEERMLRRLLDQSPGEVSAQERLLELVRVPGREPDLVAALCASGRSENEGEVKLDRFREAAEVSEFSLADLLTAADCYTQMLVLDSGNVAAMDEVIRLRRVLEQPELLAPLLSRRIELEPCDADLKCQLLHELGDLQAGTLQQAADAIQTYQALRELVPTDSKVVGALEGLFVQEERYRDLADLWLSALSHVRERSERAELRYRLAVVFEESLNQDECAVEQLRSALVEEPHDERAFSRLTSYYDRAGRYAELALTYAKRAELALSAGDIEAEVDCQRRLCTLYEGQLRDVNHAMEAYERLCELVPEDLAARRALVELYTDSGRFEDVADLLEALIPMVEDSEAIEASLTLAAVSEQHLADEGRATAALESAHRLAPNRDDVRLQLYAAYEAGQQFDALVALLIEEERGCDSGEKSLPILKRIAGLYGGPLNLPTAAIPFLERATSITGDDREILLSLCDLYIADGRQNDAVPVLEKIIASYGGRRAKEVAIYHHRLGQALEGLGKLDEAFAHYDAAFKIDLTNVSILRDLGRVCIERDDLERALKTYRALLLQRLGPDSGIGKADVYFQLGRIMAKQGDGQRAKAMLLRALAEAGDHPEATALLAELGV